MPKASNPCRRRRIHAESMSGALVWLSLARRAPATQIKLSNSQTLKLSNSHSQALLLRSCCTHAAHARALNSH